jgi:hypothetical protein
MNMTMVENKSSRNENGNYFSMQEKSMEEEEDRVAENMYPNDNSSIQASAENTN